jgi:DNA-directed RNA polymerase subunit RPC12/RpoP
MGTVFSLAIVPPYSSLEFMVALMAATTMVFLKIERVPPKEVRTLCGACKYDRAGLSDDIRCPECSSKLVVTSKPVWTLGIHEDRWEVARFPLAGALMLLLAGDCVLGLIVLPGYLLDGYSLATSLHVIPKREGYDGWLCYLYPFAGCLLIAIFAAMIEDRAHA